MRDKRDRLENAVFGVFVDYRDIVKGINKSEYPLIALFKRDQEVILRQRERGAESIFLPAALIIINITNYVTPKSRNLLNATGFFGW